MGWFSRLVLWLIFVIAVLIAVVASISWAANPPGATETAVMTRIKYWRVGDKSLTNPIPDTTDALRDGGAHFQHHCGMCHGLDGQGTGVPLAGRMSPPVADLASPRVQAYTDGQLKWIIQNGIRFTGMPGWKGVLEEEEMWMIVRYLRHLPPKGSLGAPKVYQEEGEEHKSTEQPGAQPHDQGVHEHQH
jgi:mono/diheme cytochrome c family protein